MVTHLKGLSDTSLLHFKFKGWLNVEAKTNGAPLNFEFLAYPLKLLIRLQFMIITWTMKMSY